MKYGRNFRRNVLPPSSGSKRKPNKEMGMKQVAPCMLSYLLFQSTIMENAHLRLP
jgi:hypothetical protein